MSHLFVLCNIPSYILQCDGILHGQLIALALHPSSVYENSSISCQTCQRENRAWILANNHWIHRFNTLANLNTWAKLTIHGSSNHVVYASSPAKAIDTWSSRTAIFRTVLSSWSLATAFFSTPRTTQSLPRIPIYKRWQLLDWMTDRIIGIKM